jgi:hypothetical protein
VPPRRPENCSRAFSLLELLLGVGLSGVLVLGVMQLLTASLSAYHAQINRSRMIESAHFAREVLIEHIAQAGYVPEPWQAETHLPALTSETREGNAPPGDQLGLQRWSRRDCFGNDNPVADSRGRAAFYLLQTRFRINAAANLALTCRYGPGPSQLNTQINNLGLVQGVESMQLLYAEDRDGDGIADGWVKAGDWNDESHVRAVRVALLMATVEPVGEAVGGPVTVLDETVERPADGRLRRVSSVTAAIRGRLQ